MARLVVHPASSETRLAAANPRPPKTASDAEVACAMCGHRYDPRAHTACAGCPMNLGCALCCCPHCGYSSADPAASLLLRALRRLAGWP